MTSVWGPLGWMALHSVSHNYPELPSIAEKQLVAQWIELFRDTITCPSCQGHFTELLATYKTIYPYYLDSRTEFILFTYRAHNTVNRRLDKPIYNLVEECEGVYSKNITARSAREYRSAYISHIQRHWTTMRDMNGISKLRKVGEMNRIEHEYWASRESNSTQLTGLSTSPIPEKLTPPSHPILYGKIPGAGISFTAGRLRFRR
jgi:hypothetical protein